jgi:hypothetical protein
MIVCSYAQTLVYVSSSIDLTEEGGIKAAGSSMDFAFPPELSEALRRLYHLRRGPLLSPGPVQSADDRAEMRSHFVRLPLEDCLAMMAPSLWTSGSLEDAIANHGPLLENVPPETLALWENVSGYVCFEITSGYSHCRTSFLAHHCC